ncbi:hypothetical protein HYH03_007291 [Edaphochlamys debaryana]|uniref:Uncharacterized protein n=1 Tax=Edaphochlamys debaryana TaxID=47281 RepID=A0A835YBJ5_9CHLO|nr:hypothetical protein HYH03_007291 [Edaphochlamys debaryana]|eukprot:KAG2494524.1 hypothetical protein HYH03_007291 [Edaphochlamys debaryana]
MLRNAKLPALFLCAILASASAGRALLQDPVDDEASALGAGAGAPLTDEGLAPGYRDPRVCGVDGTTYASADEAKAAGTQVLNCGPCGECSNQQDLDLYLRTRTNLTVLVRACGMRLIAKRRDKCLEALGFTPGCQRCYAENIQCDKKHCLWPCLVYTVRSWIWPAHGQQESLHSNPCLACDEANCGPAFLECAGANRRRSGIISDISRDDKEVCKSAVNYHPPATGS